MIKHDSLSKPLVVVAALITIYLSTYSLGYTLILYPAILLSLGLVLQRYYMKNLPETDSLHKDSTRMEITKYTVIAVVGFSLTGIALRAVPGQIAGWDAVLYSVLMAVAETIFFQGFILNYFILHLRSPALSVFMTSLLATVFHFARYGTDTSALAYVTVGFALLNFVTWKSGRLSPPMLAHIVNNLGASVI